MNVNYFVAAPEVGKSGTPHIQFYIAFKKQVRFTAIVKMFKTDTGSAARFFVKRGTNKIASDYCLKGEYEWVRGSKTNHEDPLFGINLSPDTLVFGTLPPEQQENGGSATEAIWERNFELAKEGNYEDMTVSHQILHHSRYVAAVERTRTPKERLKWRRPPCKEKYRTPNRWIWGPPGTGKSYMAEGMYEDFYKKPLSKWWNDYDDYLHKSVIVEDLGRFHAPYIGDMLKQWADIYPFRAEVKNHQIHHPIRPDVIIVTSNYSIKDLFPDPNVHGPLLDRFIEIHLTEKYVHEDSSAEDEVNIDLDEGIPLGGRIVPQNDTIPEPVVQEPGTGPRVVPNGPRDDDEIHPFFVQSLPERGRQYNVLHARDVFTSLSKDRSLPRIPHEDESEVLQDSITIDLISSEEDYEDIEIL